MTQALTTSPERPELPRVQWPRILVIAAVLLGSFLVYRLAADAIGSEVVTPLVKVALFIGVPLAALAFAGRGTHRPLLREVGLVRLEGAALLPGLAAAAIAAVVLLADGSAPKLPGGAALVDGIILAALTEEILFRGYAVTQFMRAGLSARAAILVAAVLFGLAHIHNVWESGDVGQMAMEIVVTGVGGIFFGAIMVRLKCSVWAAIAMHLGLNLVWEVFAVSTNAIGTRAGLIARVAGMIGALVIASRVAARASPEATTR